jgi:acyl-CoA dehydrogenase
VTAPPARSAAPVTLDDVAATAAREAGQADELASFPAATLAALRESRLLGLMVPAEYGGMGGSAADLADVTLRLAREDLSAALIFAMHCQQAATIVAYANQGLRNDLLPALARGELYLASVTTERGPGGSLLLSQSAVQAKDGLLRIDRDAPIVTGGTAADGFLITTLTPDAKSPSQVSLVYARRDQLTVEVLGDWQPLGMRATYSVPMRLSGTVPDDQVIGPAGDFRAIVTSVFGPMAHIGWSAAWLGASAGALSRVVGQLRGTEGRRDSSTSSELLLTRLARVRARLDTVHSLLRHTIEVIGQAQDLSLPPVQLLVNSLKTQAAEQCFQAVHELIEQVGLRHGYLRGSPLYLERVFRDLRSASLNYSNDRLYLVNGSLTLLDPQVRLA